VEEAKTAAPSHCPRRDATTRVRWGDFCRFE
jgi:hypothetical protein